MSSYFTLPTYDIPSANALKNILIYRYRFILGYRYIATECLNSDVLVSNGNNLIEFEVKLSWEDYIQEFTKTKYRDWYLESLDKNRRKPFSTICDPNKKFFAAPPDLAVRIAEDNDHQFGHGVLSILPDGSTQTLKNAKTLHNDKVNQKALEHIVMRCASELITLRIQHRNR